MLADLLDVAKLRTVALEYICASPARLADVQATEGFVRLGKQKPNLLLEIVAKMVPPSTSQSRKRRCSEGLPTNLEARSVSQLKQFCSDRLLPTYGNKEALIQRLRACENRT